MVAGSAAFPAAIVVAVINGDSGANVYYSFIIFVDAIFSSIRFQSYSP